MFTSLIQSNIMKITPLDLAGAGMIGIVLIIIIMVIINAFPKPTHIIHDTHTLATCERWMFYQGKSITTMTIETRDTLIFETRELSLTEYKTK